MNRGKIEILAPAGSPEALTAAVRCGADAVYLGVGRFNARQAAHNFAPEDMPETVRYCHARGTAVHIALNTLVREDEMCDALALAEQACIWGADALIIQDRGLARRIHEAAPEMPLHASTQLSCHTPSGVEELRDCGFSRVVLAREMSQEEITACVGLGCEIEVFAHGALCMCVSGQCTLSAMLGGRSGNRGMCAQPCRLPFAPVGSGPTRDRTALSLKDLCLLDYVEQLRGSGVDSLKIEGRMKRPEYVAAAVTAYRAAADGRAADRQLLEDLQAVFSRSGFTDGYYRGRRDAGLFGHRRREDVTAATAEVFSRLHRLYDRENPRVPLALTFTMRAGEPVRLEGRSGDAAAQAAGTIPEAAVHRPLSVQRAEEQLCKTGGTPFMPPEVVCRMDDGLTLPLAALNALRREVCERLLAVRGETAAVPFCHTQEPVCTPRVPSSPKLVARFADAAQCPGDVDIEAAIVPLDTPPEVLQRLCRRRTTGVEIPRGLFGADDAARRLLAAAKESGAAFALCGGVGAVRLAREASLPPVGGFGLNIVNRWALDAYAQEGAAAAVLSMELTFPQMAFAVREQTAIPAGALVYGHQPLMLLRACPRRAAEGCTGCGDERPRAMTDRRGAVFPLECGRDRPGGCVELLNGDRLFWADRLEELPSLDFWLLHFTGEDEREVREILRAYRRGGRPPERLTRGLYRRGVE
ncbi:MAG: peptidase U32 family protein [Acutalibacteraceae bacterium]